MAASANYGYDDGSDYKNRMALDVDEQVRKGPWTEEEDSMLANYISIHGEGHWNTLARSAGLRRTGKSCRLRWLNYLRPDVRRGNITLQEQLLILQLHSRWGNRWSKIAQELPGRTDNEIKNYWRTRVQKQAKQLKCDINSKQFRDTMRFVWMPRLEERIQAAANNMASDSTPNNVHDTNTTRETCDNNNSSDSASWDTQVSPVSDLTECCNNNVVNGSFGNLKGQEDDYFGEGMLDWEAMEESMMGSSGDGSVSLDNILWNEDNFWFLQQQLYD